jgi:hypothetical protein
VSDALQRLAQRAREDPFFLASALHQYAGSEGLAWEDLPGRLGIEPDSLDALALCRRPAAETFRHDVEAIGRRFGIEPDLLAEVVRRADSLGALRHIAEDTSRAGYMAARDREEEP